MAKIDKEPGQELVPSKRKKKGDDLERVVQAEIVNPRCKICQSPHRREIDMCLATGWSQAAVIRHFNQLHEIPFNNANMSVHARKHLRSSDAAVRRIWEARAREIGLDVDSVENFLLTIDGARDAIIYRGLELVQAGSLKLEGKDVLTALKDKEQSQKNQSEVAVQVLEQQFREFMNAVSDVVDESTGEKIFANFEGRLARLDNTDGRINPPPQLVQPVNEDEIDGDAEEVTE